MKDLDCSNIKSISDYMNEKREVVVTWSAFKSWDSRKDHPNREEIGVYCAIGRDNYGNERVYIGKAVGKGGFAQRMSLHDTNHRLFRNDEFLEKITQDRYIMYGTLSSKDINLNEVTDKISFIEDIEKRLIRYFSEEQSRWKLANDTKYEDCSFNNTFTIVNDCQYQIMPKSKIVQNNIK